jgi:CheY-like chemotaxis protein
MADQSTSLSRDNDGQQAGRQPLLWIGCGVSEAWIRDRLQSAAREFACLTQGEAPRARQALEQGNGSWDILFLGDGARSRARDLGPLELQIGRISLVRPLSCIVAVVPAATPEAQLALLRAGAADVVGLDVTAEQLHSVFERLEAVLLGRRQFWEREMLRLVTQLAVSVNHEINNPLTGLMGTTELLLLEGQTLSEKARRDLQTIIKQCHRIQEVTARLKNLKQVRTVPYGSHDQMIDLIGDLQPAQATQPAQPLEQFLPSPHILVIDDNPLIIDLIARLFDQRFAIDAAGCASEAMAKIERNGYDLILIDLILPEMNGLELYRTIRRIKPRQKAMLTTAYEGDARVEQAIAEGALGCIYKPFQLEDLEAAILEAIKPKI